jgi:hypothetical protein
MVFIFFLQLNHIIFIPTSQPIHPSSMAVKQAEGGPSKRLAGDGAKGKRASEGPAEGIGEGQATGAADRL